MYEVTLRKSCHHAVYGKISLLFCIMNYTPIDTVKKWKMSD